MLNKFLFRNWRQLLSEPFVSILRELHHLLLKVGSTCGRMHELSARLSAHLEQFIAGVEISSLLEGGCYSCGQQLVSGH